jgi:diphosphomevalonate decarboxylase
MNANLQKEYLAAAVNLAALPAHAVTAVTWSAPSNIALVKYWGKKPGQIPANPSLSFTLEASRTKVSVECSYLSRATGPTVEYYFEGGSNSRFGDRFGKYLNEVAPYMPFVRLLRLLIRSENTFPHSSGIASSASSFAALALCLVSLERELFGTLADDGDFFRKASFLARLGSGSACRSVYGGFALWGVTAGIDGSSDEAALAVTDRIHPHFLTWRDSVVIISAGQKAVSSSEGHRLMHRHPFRRSRLAQAGVNIGRAMDMLRGGEADGLVNLAEEEALTLHALMMTSRPGYLLMKPETLRVIEHIRAMRADTGLPVGFTLDAGANVHVLYPAAIEDRVRLFLEKELMVFTENGQIIHDRVGKGPEKTGV